MQRISKSTRTFFIFIKTSTTGIKTTFGKAGGLFNSKITMEPGFHFFIPFAQQIITISNKRHQDTFRFSIKTKDNVFATIDIAIPWKIKKEHSVNAWFSLNKPDEQIKSYVENVIRSSISQITIDELFETQEQIADKVRDELSQKMGVHGFTISDTLITDINPDNKVREAMNEINRTERLKMAAKNEADADYIKKVRSAEADARRKELQGIGMARMRSEILKGYATEAKEMSSELGVSSSEVLGFIEKIQELDTQQSIGQSDNTKVLFIPQNTGKDNMFQSVMNATESSER